MILGVLASTICYFAIMLKNKVGYDDSLDAFGIHGIGGITGAIMLTFFIRSSWMDEAAALTPGWTMWNQLLIQIFAVGIAIAYAALMTWGIIVVVDKIFKFKSSDTDEMAGLDRSYHGERAYGMLNPN